MTTAAPGLDPLQRTIAALRAAAARPMRYRTKDHYRRTVRAQDRAYFERAWSYLLRRGELVIERPIRSHKPVRYVSPPTS